MVKQTKELAVIDFEKFSIAQLPELQGKKEEIASVIKANPIVEIVDNSTYELAKKSRTAVRSLRTSLESEQKTVKKKIKERVLDVIDGEYSNLVTDVKSAEKERQDPIDTWETKKEEERLEKLRLEQERVDGIKNSISEFGNIWEKAFSLIKFENINECLKTFNESVDVVNSSEFQEYEVLFTDKVSYLRNLLDVKIHTLHEQEQIRIDNLLIEEKNAENSRIQEWQRTWNANIDTLTFDDIKDVKSVLVKSKLADLKHYSTEYNEIYTSTEKRLHSQIELISKAETQRIAQEKFQKEKAEFEAKQLEAKFQERKKYLIELGMVDDGKERLVFEDMEFRYSQIKEFSEDNWHESIEYICQKIAEFNQPKENVLEVDEIAQEQTERVYDSEPIASKTETIVGENLVQADYHEEDVDVKGVVKTHEFANYQEEIQHIEQIPTKSEVTWESIYNDWDKHNHPQKNESSVFLIWLSTNYTIPTKK